MDPEARYEARLERSKPVLAEYRQWLAEKKRLALPAGPLGKAVSYSVKHWDGLCTFLENGEVELSNNDAENAIRPFAVGRGNWLFAKSQNGAKASALCYSIIETAKANGLVPFEYLKRLLETIPNIDTSDTNVLDLLLPWSDSLPNAVRLPADAAG
jgi:transposase